MQFLVTQLINLVYLFNPEFPLITTSHHLCPLFIISHHLYLSVWSLFVIMKSSSGRCVLRSAHCFKVVDPSAIVTSLAVSWTIAFAMIFAAIIACGLWPLFVLNLVHFHAFQNLVVLLRQLRRYNSHILFCPFGCLHNVDAMVQRRVILSKQTFLCFLGIDTHNYCISDHGVSHVTIVTVHGKLSQCHCVVFNAFIILLLSIHESKPLIWGGLLRRAVAFKLPKNRFHGHVLILVPLERVVNLQCIASYDRQQRRNPHLLGLFMQTCSQLVQLPALTKQLPVCWSGLWI